MTNTQTTQKNIQFDTFEELLMLAFFGNKGELLPEEIRKAKEEELLNLFHEFVFAYIEANYGRSQAIKLKAAKQNKVDIFSKSPALEKQFEEAYCEFFKTI